MAVASGAPFTQPGGVSVAANGDAYVADSGEHSARVLRVHAGKVDPFVEDIGVGFPAGITLTHDDKTLLVSGLDPATKHDVVYFVDVASGKVSKLTQTVGAFSESAGLHRAHDTDVFAWADSQANGPGTVYTLKP
jgi:sugar lactone lactonase YvrE